MQDDPHGLTTSDLIRILTHPFMANPVRRKAFMFYIQGLSEQEALSELKTYTEATYRRYSLQVSQFLAAYRSGHAHESWSPPIPEAPVKHSPGIVHLKCGAYRVHTGLRYCRVETMEEALSIRQQYRASLRRKRLLDHGAFTESDPDAADARLDIPRSRRDPDAAPVQRIERNVYMGTSETRPPYFVFTKRENGHTSRATFETLEEALEYKRFFAGREKGDI